MDSRRIAAIKPLTEHLDDWKAALLAKGNTLTMDRYSHTFEGQLTDALQQLPKLTPPANRPDAGNQEGNPPNAA